MRKFLKSKHFLLLVAGLLVGFIVTKELERSNKNQQAAEYVNHSFNVISVPIGTRTITIWEHKTSGNCYVINLKSMMSVECSDFLGLPNQEEIDYGN